MSEIVIPEQEAAAAPPFPSLAAMRDEHSELLKRQRESGNAQDFLDDVKTFLDRGQATGTQLDLDNDRSTAQTLLDYWATALFRATKDEMPEVALAEFDPRSGGELADELCPYARLGELSEGETALYFGWQRLIGECLERLKEFRLVAIVGATGSGRSSLAKIGLLQALKAGAIPGSETWRYFPPIKPGTDPLTSLARATAPAGENVDDWVAQHARGFRRDPDHLASVLRETGIAAGVLLVDQFEEVFSHCGDKQHRRAFIENLLGAAKSSTGSHAVILVLRSDYASQVGQFESLQRLLQRDQAQVPMAFTTSELRQAIEEPAKRVGLRFDEGLVDQLLLDIQGDPAALSLLQFTLLQMWEHRQRNRITWEVYNQLGAGRLALERTAEAVYKGLSPDEQSIFRRILLQLVRPAEGQEISCSTLRREEMYQPGEPSARVDRVLDRFIDARLLRVMPHDSSPGGPQRGVIAVAHESLVGRWTRLAQWLNEERDASRRRSLLTGAAQQWHEKGRDLGALWRGSLLEEAMAYDNLSSLEKQFVQASERAEKKRATRRIQLYAAATIATVIIAGLLVANFMVRAANEKKARELSDIHAIELGLTNFKLEQSNAQVTHRNLQLITERGFRLVERGDLSGSLLWSIEAWNAEGDHTNVQDLHRVRIGSGLSQMPRLARQWSHDKLFASYTEFSTDGHYLATARGTVDGNAGQVQVWNAESDETKTLALNPDSGAVNWVSFSPDGRYLVTASGKRGGPTGQLQVWETATGEPTERRLSLAGAAITATFDRTGDRIVCAAEESEGKRGKALIWTWRIEEAAEPVFENAKGLVNHAAFSRDGRRVVVATENKDTNTGEAHVLDVERGNALCPPLGHRGGVNYAAFSPDETGRYVVTAAGDQSADIGEARVWDASTGNPRTPVLLHNAGVVYAAFSPDGLAVVTTSHDASACLWDAANGTKLQSFSHESSVNRASFSPDGRFLATASRDRTALVWDLTSGDRVTPLLYHPGTVSTATFYPNGRWLATSSRQTAQVWNLDTGTPLSAVLKTTGTVNHVDCSADGRRVITVSHDVEQNSYFAQVWELESGTPLAELNSEREVSVAALSADGNLAVTTSKAPTENKSTIKIWDSSSGATKAEAEVDGVVTFGAFSPQPKDHLLLTVSKETSAADGKTHCMLHVHDVSTGNPVTSVTINEQVNYAAFSPDSRLVIVAAGDIKAKTGSAQVFDAQSGEPISKFSQHAGGVIHASFDSDSRLVVTAGADDKAWIWDAKTGEATINGPLEHTADVTHASFSKNDKLVLTVSYDKKTNVWDAGTGKSVVSIDHGVEAMLSPDGLRAVTVGRDGIAKVWDVKSKSLITMLQHPGDIQAALFSSEGDRIFTVSYSVRSKRVELRGGSAGRGDPKRLVRTQVWSIAPERRAIDDLTAYAHLVSSRKIDPDRVAPTAIEVEALETLRAKLSDGFFKGFLAAPSPEFYLQEANNCEATEQWFAATWHLNRAIADRTKPPDVDLYFRLAWAYSQLGRWPEAIKEFTQAANLDPENWERWSYRAWAYLNSRNWNEAKDDYTRALRLEPDHSELLTQRATALAELGQWDDVVKDLSRVIERRKDDHSVWYQLGVAHLAQQDTEAYRNVCTKMLEHFNGDVSPDAANDLAWACVLARDSTPDPSRVIQLAQGAVDHAPQNYYFLNTLGAALYRAGDDEAAVRKLRDAMRAHTGQFLGQATAGSPVQQAISGRPISDEQGTAYDWFFMAMAEHRLGDKEEARNWFARSTQWMEQLNREAPDQQETAGAPLSAIHKQELAVLRAEAESALKEEAPPK